jgi:ABC-type uncharacterized transport system substrate-binding protein
MKSLYIFLISILLYAHPHVFVDVYPKINANTIDVKWVFDQMSSNMLLMDFDTNHDGVLNQKESDYLNKETFSYLKEFNYYTYPIISKNKKITNSKLLYFRATAKNGILIYNFKLTLPKKFKKIEFYDSELYTAFVLKDDRLDKNQFRIYEVDNEYYFGYGIKVR